MQFFDIFSILLTVLTKISRVVLSEGNLDDFELAHISHKLTPMECVKLLEEVYLKKPLTNDEISQSMTKMSLDDESILRRQLDLPFFNRDNCRIKLQDWSHNLPPKSNQWARLTMETILRTLGRPDLANYIRRNQRIVRYLSEITRISENAGTRQIPSKPIQLEPSITEFKAPPKETMIHYYRNPEGAKSQKSNFANDAAAGPDPQSLIKNSNDDDSTTRWTAFLILLAIIALTILATVFFALYKKSRGKIFKTMEKCPKDRCDGNERYPRKSGINVDIEQGDTTSSSRCLRKRDPRSLNQSPSSMCVREEDVASPRRSKTRKSLKIVKEQSAPIALEKKRPKRGCDKKCVGLNQNAKIDESTKPRGPKTLEKSNQINEAKPKKPRLELKKFHERIASILRKDNPPCKCCKCVVSLSNEKEGSAKCASTKNKNLCMDEKCQKTRLKSIAELCLSPEENSPTEETEIFRQKEKKRKKRMKKNARKKDAKREKKVGDKDTDKEKESEKSSPENSARSKKEKRESRIKKKPAKARKEIYNFEEACTRDTCNFGKSNIDDISNVDRNF